MCGHHRAPFEAASEGKRKKPDASTTVAQKQALIASTQRAQDERAARIRALEEELTKLRQQNRTSSELITSLTAEVNEQRAERWLVLVDRRSYKGDHWKERGTDVVVSAPSYAAAFDAAYKTIVEEGFSGPIYSESSIATEQDNPFTVLQRQHGLQGARQRLRSDNAETKALFSAYLDANTSLTGTFMDRVKPPMGGFPSGKVYLESFTVSIEPMTEAEANRKTAELRQAYINRWQ